MKAQYKQSTQTLLSNFDKQLKSILLNDLNTIKGKSARVK